MSTWAPVRSALPRANCDGVREPSVLCPQSRRGEEPSRRKAASMGRPNSPSALTRAGPSTQRNGPANSRGLREASFSAGAPPVAERFEIVADSPLYSFKIAINTEHHSTAWGVRSHIFLLAPAGAKSAQEKLRFSPRTEGFALKCGAIPPIYRTRTYVLFASYPAWCPEILNLFAGNAMATAALGRFRS